MALLPSLGGTFRREWVQRQGVERVSSDAQQKHLREFTLWTQQHAEKEKKVEKEEAEEKE